MRPEDIVTECVRAGCCPLALALKRKRIRTGKFPSVWYAAEKLEITLRQAVDVAGYWGPVHRVSLITATENAIAAGLFPFRERFDRDSKLPFKVGERILIPKGTTIHTPSGTQTIKTERDIRICDFERHDHCQMVVWNTCKGRFAVDANHVYEKSY